ncbi:DUF262 domain-containing protein [Rhodanobacter denitrificans]|nr:DUF262 domain-containing protein [Rhodanobacter denitrificans]UJJ53112.1 DUF262 domain-containing protein [Rhodanobacter denitrificans]
MQPSTLPSPILFGCERAFDVEHLLAMAPATHLREGERSLLGLVLPVWQRPAVWTRQQQVRFVEGIFLGLGTGYYVTTEWDWDHDGVRQPWAGLLLDGQQRLSALRAFAAGEFAVFGSTRFADLSLAERRRRFYRVSFPSIEMGATDEATLREIYDRLNYGGTPHAANQRATGGRGGAATSSDAAISLERAMAMADHASPLPAEATAALRTLRGRILELEDASRHDSLAERAA